MKQPVRRCCYRIVLSGVALVALLVSTAVPFHAGIRGRGKYSGVVIFDRWDTCFLLSGPYVTYISKSVKEGLRPYAGQAVQVNATDVYQPFNPGDALIRQYTLVGLAPESKYVPVQGLSFRIRPAFETGIPSFIVDIRNVGDRTIWVRTDEIGITVLGARRSTVSPSNGLSEAILTRSSLLSHSGSEWGTDGRVLHAHYTIEGLSVLADRVQLVPHSSFQVKLTFDISPGEYQILLGYGGGVHETASLASNAISFTVEPSGAALMDAPPSK